MYILEAIKKAQEEKLCIKRECWDSARIEFAAYEWKAEPCLPYVNGKRWMPRLWELTADDWVTCSQPEAPEIRRDPEPVRKKHDTDMDVILRRMGNVALGLSILSFLVAVSALVIRLLPLFQ